MIVKIKRILYFKGLSKWASNYKLASNILLTGINISLKVCKLNKRFNTFS